MNFFKTKEDYCMKMIKLKKLLMKKPSLSEKIKFYIEEAPEVIKKYKKKLMENPGIIDKPDVSEIILEGIAWQWVSKALDKCNMSSEEIIKSATSQDGGKTKKVVKRSNKRTIKRK